MIVAAGSRKVFAISAMGAQEQRVSRRCTLAVVATPFHLGLRLLPLFFLKKNRFGRMAFLQICPKTVKCQLMQTARRHLFMLTSLQVKG